MKQKQLRKRHRPDLLRASLASVIVLCSVSLAVPAYAQHMPTAQAMRAFQDGRTYCMAGRNLEAIKSLSQALEDCPDYVDALIERGIAYEQIGEYGNAVDDQGRAIAIKPDNCVAYYNRANAWFKLKQYDQAADDYRKVAQLFPQRARDMAICLATVYDAAGDPGQAAEQYANALKFGKDDAIEARRLACLQAAKSRAADSLQSPTRPVVEFNANKVVLWSPSKDGVVEYSNTVRANPTNGAAGGKANGQFANAGQMSFLPSQPFIQEAEQATGTKNAQICFLTQAFDPRWNPDGPKKSKNCGPASLAMAYRYFGKQPPGGNPDDTEQFIEATRVAMTGNTNNMSLTNFRDVVRGAEAGGLRTKIVRQLDGVDEVLSRGAIFIASGCPNMPGGYGPRFNYGSGEYGHFILVTGKDSDGYIINDPLNKSGPEHISRDELQAFLSYWPTYSLKGGIAVWR